jgi:hypothetical protein
MDGNDMGDAVAQAIKDVNPDADLSQLEPYWEAICTAIVTYMTANAVVNPGTFSNSGGPVTGAGTIA